MCSFKAAAARKLSEAQVHREQKVWIQKWIDTDAFPECSEEFFGALCWSIAPVRSELYARRRMHKYDMTVYSASFEQDFEAIDDVRAERGSRNRSGSRGLEVGSASRGDAEGCTRSYGTFFRADARRHGRAGAQTWSVHVNRCSLFVPGL